MTLRTLSPHMLARPLLFSFCLLCICLLLHETYAQKPDLPDLNVVYISRTPRYPGYVLRYQPLPGSGGEAIPCMLDPASGELLPLRGLERQEDGTYVVTGDLSEHPVESLGADDIKRWPEEGEEVTFTALVVNHGTQPSGPFSYNWYINGQVVERGTHASLDGPSRMTDAYDIVTLGGEDFKIARRKEGTYTYLSYTWEWQSGRNYVRLWVDPDYEIEQICRFNTALMDATDACSFVMMTDTYTYNTLMEVKNHWKSYNFPDILKYHRDQMHRKFRVSVSPFAPDGILEEIRIDTLLVQPEGERRDRIGAVKLVEGWDSHWDFTNYARRDEPDTRYWFARSQDWGLPHELGHQLGLIDYYNYDTEGGDGGNLVTDAHGDPILLSHFTGIIGMMRSHGDIRFSEVSASALNAQRGRRRGYYGDYTWTVPTHNYLRITDFSGQPIAGAELKIYQHQRRYVQPEVIFEGLTDEDGLFYLENRECLPFRTHKGFTIQPNPWGQINIVGLNGVFFISINARDVQDYGWLELTAMNVEYLRGNTYEATYDIATIIPSEGAGDAVSLRQSVREDGAIVLSWDPVQEGETYTVYQRVNHPPRWEIARDGADLTETEYVITHLPGNGRFTVIAEREGVRSMPATEERVVRMNTPMGITLDERGRRIVRDARHSMPLMFRADNSTIGIFGTFHLGLGGEGDIERLPDGTLLVTDNNRSPIRILDARGFPTGRRTVGVLAGNMPEEDGEIPPFTFRNPTGITRDSIGRVWVCDTGYGRIQVLDESLDRVLFTVDDDCRVTTPVKSVELLAGNLYAVADRDAGKVILISVEGESPSFVASIDVPKPVYLAANETHLFVADEGTAEGHGAVRAYTFDRQALTPVAVYDKGIGTPAAIAVDTQNGVLAVTDRGKRTLSDIPLSFTTWRKP